MLTEKIQLDGDEKVLIQVRKHWFVLVVQLLGVIIITLVPTTLYFIATQLTFIDASVLDSYNGLLLALFSALVINHAFISLGVQHADTNNFGSQR